MKLINKSDVLEHVTNTWNELSMFTVREAVPIEMARLPELRDHVKRSCWNRMDVSMSDRMLVHWESSWFITPTRLSDGDPNQSSRIIHERNLQTRLDYLADQGSRDLVEYRVSGVCLPRLRVDT